MAVTLAVASVRLTPDRVLDLKDLLLRYPGNEPFHLRMIDGGRTKTLLLDDRVDASQDFMIEAMEWLDE